MAYIWAYTWDSFIVDSTLRFRGGEPAVASMYVT